MVLPIAGLVALMHLGAAALGGGYWFDEVYMLAIGREHLDWGSADQPPLTPALAAMWDWAAPGSILALRIPAVVATAGSVVLAGLIARELGGDRRAQALTAAAQATVVWTALAGHWLTPYAIEPVQWLLLAWLLLRWIRLRDDRLLVAIGVVVGVAAMTKFQVLLWCAVVLLTVAALGPRALLRRPLLWVGAGIAVLLALPTLVWQATHGWPQLAMARVVAGEAEALYGGRAGIAIELLAFAGVLGLPLLLYGLGLSIRRCIGEYRFLAATFVVLYAVFVITEGRPYYLCGMYAPVAAIGAVGLQRRRESGRTRLRWVIWPAATLGAALAIACIVLSTSITRSDTGAQIAQRTADAYRALPESERERTAIVGQSYIIAAYLDGYSTRYGLPQAHSTNRSYGYFGPPDGTQDSALVVGSNPDELLPYFGTARHVGDATDDLGIWLLAGRTQPWDALWPRLRTLTVT